MEPEGNLLNKSFLNGNFLSEAAWSQPALGPKEVIHAQGVVKRFGDFEALSSFDLNVFQGECVGLLGPNGAGKSTFIGTTYGSVVRSGGTLRVFGHDPNSHSKSIKRRLGVVTQDNALDESLSVQENMELYAAFEGLDKRSAKVRIQNLLEYMNAAHKKKDTIQSLSGGMKRRLVFVRALLSEPELLILDEPTTGLDPAVRHLLWGKVRELREKGVTLLLTTHYIHEAEVLCDRVVILNKGSAVAAGSPKELIDKHVPGVVGVWADPKHMDAISQWATPHRVLEMSSSGQILAKNESAWTLRCAKMEELSAFGQKIGFSPAQMRPANLEDVFLKITGQGIDEDA